MKPHPGSARGINRLSGLLALTTLAVFSNISFALDFTWTGTTATAHDWTDSANWLDAAVPTTGANTDNLAFFSDTFTALSAGSIDITTNAPAALTLRSLTLRGLGSDSGDPTGVIIGTNACTWTMDRSDAGNALINLDGMAGTQGLDFTIASNITLITNGDALTVQGNGTAAFDFTGALTRNNRAFRKEGTSAITLSGTITGSADFEAYGGTLNVPGSLHTSTTSGKVTSRGIGATVNLSGIAYAGTAGLGVEGTGSQLNVTGGTTTVTGNAVFIAPDANQTCTMHVSGGLLSVAAGKNLWIGADGYNGNTDNDGFGVLTISDAGLVDTGTTTTGTFRLGGSRAGSDGTGTLNLNGGILAVNRGIVFGTKANSGTFNFNGGTLKANGTSATIAATTTGRVNVRDGGAIINTNGFNITLTEELQHSDIPGDAATDGGLRKQWTGTLTLPPGNTYTGPTVIEAGTLKFPKRTGLYGGNDTQWTGSNLNVGMGATLAIQVGGADEFTNADVTTLLTNLAASPAPEIGMVAGSNLAIDTTNATGGFTINDVLADSAGDYGGSRGFQKLGGNTLTLTGFNTYTGGTAVNGGTLVIGHPTAIGTGPLTVATTANTVIYGGTNLSGANALANNLILSVNTRIDGPENIDLTGNITRNNVGLYKYGSGTLTLSGTGSGGTGDLECWAGALNVTGSWGTALSAGKITARGTGGVINWSGNGYAGSLYGLGAEGDGGQVNVTGGSLSISATGSAIFLGSTPATGSQISVSGGSVLVTANGAVRIGAGGYNGATSNGPSALTVSGTGVLDTGVTTGVFGIGSGIAGNTVGTGVLNLNTGGTLATARTITSGSVANGTLNFNGGTFRANAATAAVILDAALGRANVRDGGAVFDSNGFDFAIAQSLVHSDIVGDAPTDGGLTKTGSGTLVLSGTNTYTGPTRINSGALVLGSPAAIPNAGTGVTVAAGAGFGFQAANFTDAEIQLIAGHVSWAAGGTSRLVLDTQGGSLTVGADFAGGGYELLAKGGGSLVLTGNVAGVTIHSEDGTVVTVQGGEIKVGGITMGAGTNPGTRKATITFTAPGAVDVYASDDLENWGTAIATGVSASPFVEDNLTTAKRFYTLVPAGQPAP
ncbi:MAG: autotransporter-associated beta strand repeat-containing protein [Verrucomicrobia bacterium]|nr:autotransporter-associated beta strand repeat-containing protein [Verrucomicrobiota bacterium]